MPEERSSRGLISLFRQQKVYGIAKVINCAIQIGSFPFDLDVGVSKLKEPPLQLLAELSVTLSRHSAPIIQPMVDIRASNEEIDKATAWLFSPIGELLYDNDL